MNHKLNLPGLTFHHVGLLVASMDDSVVHYKQIFGHEAVSEVYVVSSQQVKVCFVEISCNSFIELVQPLSADSLVSKLLKKNITYYHIAYKVTDIESSVTCLEKLNYKPMEYFTSEAFCGKRCIFLFSPEAHLVELIQE